MDRLLTTCEAARFLAISPRTLAKWRYTGGGPPAVKFGRAVRYLEHDLTDWIAARRETRTHETAAR